MRIGPHFRLRNADQDVVGCGAQGAVFDPSLDLNPGPLACSSQYLRLHSGIERAEFGTSRNHGEWNVAGNLDPISGSRATRWIRRGDRRGWRQALARHPPRPLNPGPPALSSDLVEQNAGGKAREHSTVRGLPKILARLFGDHEVESVSLGRVEGTGDDPSVQGDFDGCSVHSSGCDLSTRQQGTNYLTARCFREAQLRRNPLRLGENRCCGEHESDNKRGW